MKDLHGTFIFAICLLAFTAVVFFFKYGQQRVHSHMLEAEAFTAQNIALNAEKTAEIKAKEAARLARIAQQSAISNMEKAKEARQMLEKAREKTKMTQQEIVDKLNRQLEREADARISAENAKVELAKQRDILHQAVQDTRMALEKLQKERKDNSSDARISKLQELLKAREAEIAELKRYQAILEKMRMEAVEAQKRTELEIESRGGRVTLPRARRIISPNIPSVF